MTDDASEYCFEMKDADHWTLSKDKKTFLKRIKLSKIPSEEIDLLIDKYLSATLRNVHYYKKKIAKENFWRYAYSIFTFLIVVTVPILVFLYTDNAVTENSDVNGLEAVGVVLTALLTSLLGMHQLVSAWAGKRKFRALFHQAKMDLLQLHYELEDDAKRNFHHAEGYDFPELIDALHKATKTSREIVNTETKHYFELSGTPVVDLGSIFSSSISSANSLVSAFSSKKYTSRLEELKEEEKQKEEKVAITREKMQQKQIALKATFRKMARLERKTTEIDSKMDLLEAQGLDNLSPEDQKVYSLLMTQFDALDDERDALGSQIENLEDEVASLEITLEEYLK